MLSENGGGWHRSDRSKGGARSLAVGGIMILAAFAVMMLAPAAGASHLPLHAVLKVPSKNYPTIQSAINAAKSGDTIHVAPGTYVEQLTIHKSITLNGSGAGKTIIKSPAALGADPFGNPWTIEIDDSATVTLSRFTLLVTLQCILTSGLPRDHTAHPHLPVFAGGGIGVGGGANMTLRSAMITTTGATEGATCGSSGIKSFGTGVDFGLDYVTGSPAASRLVGTGTVSGVTISGFGFAGPPVSVGGQANSPTGSYARIAHDRITTSADESSLNDSPAISVGFGGNASSATIVGNAISTLPSLATNVITVFSESSVSIAYNSILVGPEDDAIVLYTSTAAISFNSIAGSTTDFSGGIILYLSSASISFNALSDFGCAFNLTVVALGLCGPNFLSQAQVTAIADYGDAGLGTTIEFNLISKADIGIALADAGIALGFQGLAGCTGCVVKGNLISNSSDYAFLGIDGNYSFVKNLIVGGLYGVAAVAFNTNTTVTLSHVLIVKPSAAHFYHENDCLAIFGYTCTETIVGK
jgi:hypothetical protein